MSVKVVRCNRPLTPPNQSKHGSPWPENGAKQGVVTFHLTGPQRSDPDKQDRKENRRNTNSRHHVLRVPSPLGDPVPTRNRTDKPLPPTNQTPWKG